MKNTNFPVKAKKHLGQHFLNDQVAALNIVNALTQTGCKDPIIEVGPGTGVLTQYLIQQGVTFIALDVDTDSIAYLKKTYPEKKDCFLIEDYLKFDPSPIYKGKYSLIGNFPYNISSQIMFRVLEEKEKIDYVVGMFQKEVAERIAEKPGSKTYGILSVLLQAFYDIEYLFTVEPTAFIPPPKVRSAVIRLKRNSVTKLDCDEVQFKKVVKTAFNQRRKTLRNALKSICDNPSLLQDELFEKRAERLSVADFVHITNLFFPKN